MWWPFIDGRHLTQGVDLQELFETLPADRMMNVIDNIIVDDALSGSMIEGGIEKIRTSIVSVYNGRQNGSTDNATYDPTVSRDVKPMHQYTQMTENGLEGFEAPLG